MSGAFEHADARTKGAEMTPHERKIEELLLHLRGLVFVRAILEQRDASEAELERHSSEITLVRARLAREQRRLWTADDVAGLSRTQREAKREIA